MSDEDQVVVRAYALSGSDGIVRNRATRYCGYAVRESGGAAAATALIYDGTTAAGTLVDVISIPTSGMASSFIPGGIICEKGIYIDVGGTGVIQGSIRVGD